ncbi:MAG: helix-turn-helix domain-containing protein [Pseudonocardiaceae bacterium]|nr:helix-turn-helix domain-containing protein [Pseudonocardiaceae bacterium]
MPASEGGIAARVAEERKLAGLTQQQLAQRSNVSTSLLRKVEQGTVPASPAFVSATARALGVGVAELLEQPYERTTRSEQRIHATIPPLRRELAAYTLPPDDVRPRSLDQLAAAVADASTLRHAVNLDQLGAELPGLLAELRAATYQHDGHNREAIYGLLAEAYAAAGQVAWKLGYTDLSSLTTERIEWAAARSGDELAAAAADFYRAGELISAAEWKGALRFLDDARHRISDRVHGDDEPGLAMHGVLHLKSGLAAARAGDAPTADAHLSEAHDTARWVRPGSDHYRLAFDRDSVNIWSVGLAVERCDGTEAVKRADGVTFGPTAPRERVGHHWIDLARGYLLHGDRDRSIATLQRAKATAPQQTRYHPMVHETIRTLARAQRKSDPIARLAAWAGVREA